jgi:inhibitor of cysteine peptidase
MMKSKALLATIVLVLVSLGCAGGTPTVAPPTVVVPQDPVAGVAQVDSVEVLILESFPVQIHVVARGNLPDGCTTVDQVTQERDGNAFTVTITTIRPSGQVCTQALVPFERVIALDVLGLPAGVYTVTVNGVSETFELQVDNVTPEPVGAIGGTVWHDLCAPPWGDPPPTPPEGCVERPDGGYEANGVLEAGEPGIAGVRVTLGAGACPSTGVAETFAGSDGSYLFAGLEAGTYCISIDPLDATNESILIPGGWTYPARDVGSATLEVAGGVEALGVHFGWDYQFLP